MKLEVLSKESNQHNWILAALKRRTNNLQNIDDDTLEEVANELKLTFERKQNGNL